MNTQNGFGSAKLPSENLETNIRYVRNIFEKDDTLQFRRIQNNSDPAAEFCLIYVDGMINNKLVNDDIVCPLMNYRFPEEKGDRMELLLRHVVFADSTEKSDEVEKIVTSIVYGDTVLLAEGSSEALLMNTKGYNTRSIEEPEGERVLCGPREGFNESLLVNLSMLRRKLHTPDLKMTFRIFGKRTRTKACICYLDSLVDRNVLETLQKRLENINIDGTLDTEYLAELISDRPCYGIDTIGSTERPDIVAAKLLEGRVAILLDGTPQAITLPHLFIENFQSDEDYYLNFFFASIGRVLRIISFFISVTLPAFYIALVTFHPEMLPTPMLISISQARQGVPFPTVLEMLFMLIVFEMLRESGARMPGLMGQTLSIVGALVIGDAAVKAKIVSAPIIIVVALSGITGMMNPKIKGFSILARFSMMVLASMLGLYGFLFGMIALLVRLYATESFGVPIMQETDEKGFQNLKDIGIRAPWWEMIRRPAKLTKNRVRQKRGGQQK